MDLTAKRMYDIFKEQIWKDLGPLDPNWFESLTAEALAGHSSDQDELCANQEALFKTPLKNRGPSSQMCSTPKLFKHRPVSSHQQETESFSAEPETLPCIKASPSVLQMGTSQTVDLFPHSPKSTDAKLHHSPDQPNTSFDKHISERLGATVGDISWTSSLNTPPPKPSTLILNRKAGSNTVTVSEGPLMLVRECFQSNLSTSADGILPDSPEQPAPLIQDAELNGPLKAPTKDKQAPNSTEDKVEALNSAFCTKNSVVRKVRPERVSRRLIIPSNENSHGAVKVSSTNTTVINEDSESGNMGLSQWSPLSLSEISIHSGVPDGKPDVKDSSPPVVDHEAESKKVLEPKPDTTDTVTEKTLQRSQSQVSEPAPLANNFSPAACLTALRRAKQRAKPRRSHQHCQNPTTPHKEQSSIHDSGFSSVAETALLSSTVKPLLKLDTPSPDTELEKEVVCEAICQTEEGSMDVSSGSLTRANHFFSNIEEDEIVRTSRSEANGDFHLTVSQKAEVNELCALLEQQSESQFEFTQPTVESFNQNSLNKPCPLVKSSETDSDTVKHVGKGEALVADGLTKMNQRQNVLLKDEARRNIEAGDQIGNHFEGDLNPCQGFKTAGGKGINVSAKSMQKYQNLFKDCDLAPEDVGSLRNNKNESGFNVIANEMDNNCTPPRRGFKRAHDTHPLPAKPAKRAKLSLPDCEDVKPHYPKRNLNSFEMNKPVGAGVIRETLSSGFTTAGGKRVQISEKDFEKVKHLWKDFDDGLKTANEFCPTNLDTTGIKASDSADPLHKTKPLLREHPRKAPLVRKTDGLWAERKDHLKFPDPYVTRKDSGPGTCGFSSASGKALRVSAEAFLKAKAMFDDIGSASGIGAASPMPKTLAKSTEPIKASSDSLSSLHLSELSTERKSSLQNSNPPYCNLENGLTAASKKEAVAEEPLNAVKRLQTEETESKNELQDISLNKTFQCKDILHKPDSLGGGFSTASGKKVAVSEEALNRAKRMLTDGIESKNGAQDLALSKKVNSVKQSPSHVASALGKTVSVKSVLAKALHNTNTSAAPAFNSTCVKTSGSGFTTAGGKKVTVSEEALNKAMTFLSENVEQDSDANVYKKENDSGLPLGRSSTNLDNMSSNISCINSGRSGFTTANGKKVTVSEEALDKAMNFLTEKNDQVSDAKLQLTKKNKDSSGLTLEQSISNFHASDISCIKTNTSGFTTASGKKVIVSEEALNKAMNSFSETMDQDKDPMFLGTKTNKNVRPSLPLEQSISNFDDAPASDISCIKTNTSGFTTASGKKVTVSEEALNKAMNLLSEKVQDSDANVSKKKKDSSLPLERSSTNLDNMSSNFSSIKNCGSGFATASGKKVTVSEEALNKAVNFLSEKMDQEKDPMFLGTKTKKGGPGLPLRRSITNFDDAPALNISCVKNNSSGFTTASGKKVTVSEEALNKAVNFLTEKNDQNNDTKPQVTKKNKDGLSLPLEESISSFDDAPASNISCIKTNTSGFSTAGGKKVTVSEEALNKAMTFLSEKDEQDGDARPSPTELVSRESNAKILQRDFVQSESTSLKHISNRNPVVKADVKNVNSVSLNIHEDLVSEPDQSSVLYLDVPSLSDCTSTQQQFLAQEALDCTRALLEDEVRAAQSLTDSLEHLPKQTNGGTHSGKRRLEDLTDLPGLGGNSPEDLDEALDRRKDVDLNPMKSCLSVLYKDRSVFQYQAPLRPNVTKTHRFGKDFANTPNLTSRAPPTPVRREQQDLKTPLFVPPFLNTRTKASRGDVTPQKKEKPSTFVPPFKKLKPEGNSLKTQHEEQDLIKKAPKTCHFTPPARKQTENDHRNKPDAFPHETEGAGVVCDHKRAEESAEVKEATEIQETGQEILLDLEKLALALDLQDLRIRKKSRQTVRPLPGTLFLTKSSRNKRSFRAAVDGRTPQKFSQTQLYVYGVDQAVGLITSDSAEDFRFSLFKFYKRESFAEAGAVQLADGGWLVPRSDGTAGKGEFYRALCDTPGVDPKLLSQSWVFNHYRWVVWKLASMERAFPETMASVCLTPEQVLLQLKYRYDVEVDHSRRPCLRKIMERDDTSAKTLVLCVCGVASRGQACPGTPQEAKVRPEPPGAVVWLTDGWYTIKAQLDKPLTALLHRGSVSEGVKLMIHGAQLVGSQEACSPLEAPENLLLKIFANSTRRVRWDTKLGFYRDPRPFALPLSSVLSAGGAVCCVDMVILRAYPIQWMERRPDGGVVFRSERAEEKEARRYNTHKQKTMEAIYAKIKAGFENEEKERMKSRGRRRTVRREDLSRCQDGEELFEAVGDEADVEAYLTPEQLQTLGSYKRSLMEQSRAVLQERLRRALEEAEAPEGSCPKRDMATVWRLSIADYRDQAGSAVYQLSIWNPSSDVQAALAEGGRYKASNLAASEGRSQSGRSTVQLSSTRKTHFSSLQASPEQLRTLFQPRVSVTFAELQNPDFRALCGEVDLAGCIVSISDQNSSLYLVDQSLDVVKVQSVVGFGRCGWDDVLGLRGLVALSNLQVRTGCSGAAPVLQAGDLSALSTHPREAHLRQALGRLQRAVQDQQDFFVRAEKRLFEIVSSSGLSFPAVNPRTPQSPKTTPDLRTSVAKRQLAAYTPPGNPTPSSKKDPRTLKRRRALDYLCQFPPPPPLSRLSSGASPGVKKTFLPPRSSVTPSAAPGATGRTSGSSAGPEEEGWVHDDELVLIDTQELRAADALLD